MSCEFTLYSFTRLAVSREALTLPSLTRGWTQSPFFLYVLIDLRPMVYLFHPNSILCLQKEVQCLVISEIPRSGLAANRHGSNKQQIRKRNRRRPALSLAPASGDKPLF